MTFTVNTVNNIFYSITVTDIANLRINDMLKMMSKNNLKKLIKAAGLSHAEVADAKGIAPESLSRHASGRSQFSIEDAIDYAKILGVDPSAILFEDTDIPVFGKIYEGVDVKMVDASDTKQIVETSMRFPPYCGAFINERKVNNTFLDGSIVIADCRPIQSKSIPQSANGRCCIVKTINGNLWQQTVFPQPDNKFTLSTMSGHVHQDEVLVFACPVLFRVERPELLGIKVKNSE